MKNLIGATYLAVGNCSAFVYL